MCRESIICLFYLQQIGLFLWAACTLTKENTNFWSGLNFVPVMNLNNPVSGRACRFPSFQSLTLVSFWKERTWSQLLLLSGHCWLKSVVGWWHLFFWLRQCFGSVVPPACLSLSSASSGPLKHGRGCVAVSASLFYRTPWPLLGNHFWKTPQYGT